MRRKVLGETWRALDPQVVGAEQEGWVTAGSWRPASHEAETMGMLTVALRRWMARTRGRKSIFADPAKFWRSGESGWATCVALGTAAVAKVGEKVPTKSILVNSRWEEGWREGHLEGNGCVGQQGGPAGSLAAIGQLAEASRGSRQEVVLGPGSLAEPSEGGLPGVRGDGAVCQLGGGWSVRWHGQPPLEPGRGQSAEGVMHRDGCADVAETPAMAGDHVGRSLFPAGWEGGADTWAMVPQPLRAVPWAIP